VPGRCDHIAVSAQVPTEDDGFVSAEEGDTSRKECSDKAETTITAMEEGKETFILLYCYITKNCAKY